MGLISTNYREYETIYVLRPELEDSLGKRNNAATQRSR